MSDLICGPQRLVFGADDAESFGAYHDLYAGGSTVSRSGTAFSAAVMAYRFPRMLLFDRQVAGVVHHRDEARVRRDGFDHFTLQVLRSGDMAGGPPGDERPLAPGDVILFDTTRPQRTRVDGADYVTVTLAREQVEAAVPEARRLHGAVLSRPAAGLLGDFLLSLARHAHALGPDAGAQGAAVLADLLAAAAGGVRPPAPAEGGGADYLGLQRDRAEAFIDAHLGNPLLDADAVAAGLGLSRSTLYRAFAPVDGVARRITARRLERLRAALRRPSETRSVASLSFDLGFASESHCGRAFKAAFGVAPGQFRADARRSRELRAGGGRAGPIADWHCELY